jgi:hypothetical protein
MGGGRQMNPNEINKRIDIARGILPQEGYFCHHCGYSVAGKYVTFDERHDILKGGCGGFLGIKSPTNYYGDLNVMHEAEKWVSEKGKEGDYWFFLRELLDFPEAESDWGKFYFFAAIHATARQRAEAFLRTIGQWEDGK